MDKKIFFSLLGAGSILNVYANNNPNVVLIYVDDLGFGDVGINGSKYVSTPNLDALASSGINFTNAHSTAAVSTPSRYSLLTGEYAWRKPGTGILKGDAGMIISPDTYTIADLFHDNGYNTAAIGKWHLGLGETSKQDWNNVVTPGANDLGFDYTYLIPATGDRTPCVFLENGKVVNLDKKDPIEVSYKKSFPGEPSGKDNPELLRMKISHGHDQAIINGISRIGYMRGGKSALWKDEDIADTLVSKAKQFIDDNSNNPFFLYFATHDIHVPRVPNERFKGRSGLGVRGDVIMQLDWTVGEIVKKLKEVGCYENTMIIFSSDNGPVLNDGYDDGADRCVGNHKITGIYRGGKASAYEGGTRVPLFISWPGKIKSCTSRALVSHVDLVSSLGYLLEGKKADRHKYVDSQNYINSFLGKDFDGRPYIITQSGREVLMVVSRDYKYIEATSNGKSLKFNKTKKTDLGILNKEQLFNLKNDPSEKNDISLKEINKVEEMRNILIKEKNKN